MAIQPVRWPAFKDWRQVVVRTWKEAGDDNVSFLAAAVAFYAFLAFVPMLASAMLVYGLAAEPATVAGHISEMFRMLPRDAAILVADQLKSMTESPDTAKGWSLIAAIALAIYGASKGAGAIVTALNIAYEVKESRGFIKSTLLSLAMTLGALVVLGLAAGAIAAMGWVEALFPGFPAWAHDLFQILSWAGAAVAVGFALAAVYRYAPNRPDAPWVWISPGSAAATLLWLLASLGFGLYVSRFGNYNATYGSLGGVVVFLTWLYLGAYILLMGGELNSELERQQAKEAGVPTFGKDPSLGAASGEKASTEPGPAPMAAPPGMPPGERVSWPLAALGLALSRLRRA